MSVVKKPIFALIGVMAMLFVGLLFASSAQAYPPPTPATLSVSDTNPTCGEAVTVSGAHYQPGETVTITQGGKSYTVTANSAGRFSLTITIVCIGGQPGAVTAVGGSSGDVASISLTAATPTPVPPNNNNNGGNLSTTGVAVIGIGALGVVLLVGGGLLLLAGRRRTSASA